METSPSRGKIPTLQTQKRLAEAQMLPVGAVRPPLWPLAYFFVRSGQLLLQDAASLQGNTQPLPHLQQVKEEFTSVGLTPLNWELLPWPDLLIKSLVVFKE